MNDEEYTDTTTRLVIGIVTAENKEDAIEWAVQEFGVDDLLEYNALVCDEIIEKLS